MSKLQRRIFSKALCWICLGGLKRWPGYKGCPNPHCPHREGDR